MGKLDDIQYLMYTDMLENIMMSDGVFLALQMSLSYMKTEKRYLEHVRNAFKISTKLREKKGSANEARGDILKGCS